MDNSAHPSPNTHRREYDGSKVNVDGNALDHNVPTPSSNDKLKINILPPSPTLTPRRIVKPQPIDRSMLYPPTFKKTRTKKRVEKVPAKKLSFPRALNTTTKVSTVSAAANWGSDGPQPNSIGSSTSLSPSIGSATPAATLASSNFNSLGVPQNYVSRVSPSSPSRPICSLKTSGAPLPANLAIGNPAWLGRRK